MRSIFETFTVSTLGTMVIGGKNLSNSTDKCCPRPSNARCVLARACCVRGYRSDIYLEVLPSENWVSHVSVRKFNKKLCRRDIGKLCEVDHHVCNEGIRIRDATE